MISGLTLGIPIDAFYSLEAFVEIIRRLLYANTGPIWQTCFSHSTRHHHLRLHRAGHTLSLKSWLNTRLSDTVVDSCIPSHLIGLHTRWWSWWCSTYCTYAAAIHSRSSCQISACANERCPLFLSAELTTKASRLLSDSLSAQPQRAKSAGLTIQFVYMIVFSTQ